MHEPAVLAPSSAGVRREPYSAEELRPLIAPRSVAVIGASPRASALGARTVKNILTGSLADAIHLVNPRYDRVDGRPCVASIADVPAAPDLAIVAVPRDGAMAALEECAEAGVPAAIVYTSGFAETTDDSGAGLQQSIRSLARDAGMRICGPNCMGLINLVDRIELVFAAAFAEERVLGRVGIACQSGGLGYTLLQAQLRGVGFSYAFMPGNSSDVDVVDFMNFLVDDPSTDAIAAVIEGIDSGERLRIVAERAREAGKPIIAQKLGTGAVTRAAARSHTGSMTGSSRVFAAAFERLGIVQVEDYEAVVETAQFFARAGVARSDGVAVISGSGGGAVVATDRAEAAGLDLPPPGPESRAEMAARIPPYGSVANPADLTADLLSDQEGYRACLVAMGTDPQYGVVVFPQTAAGEWVIGERVHTLREVARALPIPLVVIWMSEWLEGAGSQTLEGDERLAMFRSARRCFEAVALWQRWSRWLRASGEADEDGERRSPAASSVAEVARVIDAAAAAGGGASALDERESKRLLAGHGVPVPRHAVAAGAEEAAAAAERLGGKVAIKVLSREILHKARIGGVVLGVEGASPAARAYEQIRQNLEGAGCGDGPPEVLVEEMAPAGGRELIVGARRDPHFGGIVMVGLGGSEVEVRDEAWLDIMPVGLQSARRLLARLPGADTMTAAGDHVAGVVTAVASVLEADDRIDEIDVNPLLVRPDGGVLALDAVITCTPLEEVAP